MKIIFYDIPSRLAQKAWSPNTWKTRYCLNFKHLAYHTEWVEYPDIEAHCIKHRIPPTSTKMPGAYTLPAIHDPSTRTTLADSFAIAQYLDHAYPDAAHSIFPHGTAGVQAPFARAFALNMSPIFDFLVPPECEKLNPRSAVYFRRTREATYGKKLEDITPKGERRLAEWAKVKLGLHRTNEWYAQAGGSGPFIMGSTPCWADFVVGGYMAWARAVWGEDSEEWRDISSWDDGRWKALVEGLKKYEEVK